MATQGISYGPGFSTTPTVDPMSQYLATRPSQAPTNATTNTTSPYPTLNSPQATQSNGNPTTAVPRDPNASGQASPPTGTGSPQSPTPTGGITVPAPTSPAGSPVTGALGPAPGNGWGSVTPGTADSALQGALQRGLTGQAAADYVNQYFPGIIAYYPNFKGSGHDVFGTQAGYVTNEGGGWNYVTRGPEGAAGAGSGATGPGTGNVAFPTGSINDTPQSAQQQQLYNLLLQRAQEPLPQGSDPIIRAQTDAYGAQQTRAARNYLSTLAEQGGANANLGAQTRSVNENVAQANSSFTAQVMYNQLAQRQQDINAALSGASGLLTAEQSLSLQEELAKIQAALQQAQLQQNAYQFDTNNNNTLAGF